MFDVASQASFQPPSALISPHISAQCLGLQGQHTALGYQRRHFGGHSHPRDRYRPICANASGQGHLAIKLEDILADHLDVVFCGINPGKGSAAIGQHFANRSNRFWRTLHQAGFTPHEIHPEDGRTLLHYHCGLTTVVERPTASASELAQHEFQQAAVAFELKIRHCRPRYVAFLGKAGYAALSGQREIAWGLQPQLWGEARVWVLPNPSGRNLAFSLEQLVAAYQPLRMAIAQADPVPLIS